MFVEGAVYHLQIGKLKTTALFDTGASINAISRLHTLDIYEDPA